MLLRVGIAALLIGVWPAIALAQAPPPEKHKKLTEETEEKAPPADDAEAQPHYNTVVLQGLNKVTGHISKIEGPVEAPLRFDNLEIVAHRCWKSSPEDRPENAALLEIFEVKPGEGSQRIFLGWMFSSSPGLSGLEHPVYDINVLSCELRKEKTPEKKETK